MRKVLIDKYKIILTLVIITTTTSCYTHIVDNGLDVYECYRGYGGCHNCKINKNKKCVNYLKKFPNHNTWKVKFMGEIY